MHRWRPRLLGTVSLMGLWTATFLVSGVPVQAETYPSKPLCGQSASALCTEVENYQSAFGHYVGHDEPSALFYSSLAGSGNNNLYHLYLPKDPPTRPVQDGSGGTFNFQLHPAFWFGMAMCDDQSAPNPGGSSFGATVACTPDSDSNIFNSSDPTSSSYIGRHPGTAFMEMQFYPPGWAKWPFGNSCDATQWCAALNIDSLSQNMNAGTQLNPTCAATTGIEYVNFAFITKNGTSQAPANPVDSTFGGTFTPDATKDLFMNSGDALSVNMHDSASGFQVQISDLTTGQSGSMTASAANGFGEVQFAPKPSTACVNIPTNFHPMYSTSSPNTRVPWAAHSYNVAFSDEIGHFEYCNGVDPRTFTCNGASASDAGGLDGDDQGCLSPAESSSVRIGGCLGTDTDFDGVPYQNTWPGTFSNAAQDSLLHPTPIQFTSPLFNGTTRATTVAFEADLPRIEFATNPPCQRHISNPADPSPGSGCVNPPTGANFYPFFSTATSGSACRWQEGGSFIPGANYAFGSSSHDVFGPLYVLFYPAANGKPSFRYNNFNSGPLTTSC